MNTTEVSYQEAIATLGITQDRFRYLLRLFGTKIQSITKGKERFLLPPAMILLTEVIALITTGLTPKDAVSQITSKHELLVLAPENPIEKSDERLKNMETALFMIAEEMKNSRQEILSLRSEVSSLRFQLAPPLPPAQKVIPWQPHPKVDTSSGVNVFKRFWITLFHPEKFRRLES